MSRAVSTMSLVLDRETVAGLYPEGTARHRRERRIPLSPELMEVMPARVRAVIRKALGRGGMEAYLVDSDEGLCVVIRNKRRY